MPLALTTVFADLPDPRVETANKLHRLDRHPGHRHLRRHRRGRRVGGDRRVRPDQGGLLPPVPGAAQRHPQPRHLRAGLRQARPGRVRRPVRPVDGRGVRGDRAGPRRHRRQECATKSAKDTFTGCLHLVNAWAVENRLILGAAVGARGRARDHDDPRPVGGAGPGRGGGDASTRPGARRRPSSRSARRAGTTWCA